ncbi:putative extracellular ligand-binding protein [Malaciobacter marinus]|uniref:Amino acid-binding protein n=1 Tax=Malaciobacter marinus TaxID=505249 RepID=A0A347TM93_9BACT|nr:ABC transporter substrate-binding protein [Malaciobacter marinus]AXX87721.1 putative extracellular ligand-binding protein [Malaciobacter marinus]PHO12347.1 amino acid-binding protein [Malaciobacter marinus]PHO15040.1 amino acid-binding protein [Malaciobacter marinus]
MTKKLFILISILLTIYFIFKDKEYRNPSIKLGGSIPKTGVIKEWGEAVTLGANSYFNYSNDNKLLGNKKIEYIIYDDKYEPKLTMKNTNKLLYQDEVFALFGYVGTPTVKSVLPTVEIENIPFISSFTGAGFLRNKNQNNFLNFRSSYQEEIEVLIKYLHYNKKISKFAVFYQNDDYGEEGYVSVIKSLKKRKLKLIAEGSYKRNTLSISHAFNEIKNANPQAIIMIGANKANALFIKKAKENPKFKDTLFCNISFGDANAMIKELKQSNTNNLIFSQVVPNFQDRTIPVVNEYYEVLNKYNKDFEPGFISLEAFLSAKLVVSALKDIKGALTKENFITAYKELPENTLKGIKIDFENKQLLNKIYLFTYENNRFKEINK